MSFPEIILSGSPAERGFAHGETLSSEIEAAIDYYATIFSKSSAEIFDLARHFRNVIHEYNPAYCAEIEGIANGAKIDPLWIYALNSRSEILALDASSSANECTSICFEPTALLGQTWDWGRPLEKLVVLMQINIAEDHKIQMLTEPGIIGKIGMNSQGIGACLNILLIDKPLDGVPIHIVLRAVLESRTLEEARAAIQRSGNGKASNILFGDRGGNFSYVEFAGDKAFVTHPKEPFAIHTNHYLAHPINPDNEDYRHTHTRFRTARAKATALSDFNFDEMKTILSDRSESECPIWRPYQVEEELGEVGTLATIIMDLKEQRLYIRKGNEGAEDFVVAFES